MAFLGGQFKSATHGQFKSAQGGQFDRLLHFMTCSPLLKQWPFGPMPFNCCTTLP